MKKTLVALMAFLFSLNVFANLSAFNERFEIVKDDNNKVKLIRDRSLGFKFKLLPLLKHYQENLRYLKTELKRKDGLYDIEQMLFEEMYYNKGEKNNENLRIVMRSLKNLENVDLDNIYKNPKFKKVMNMFESKITNALEALDPRVIAHTQNPTFFYKKQVVYNITKKVLDYAKKKLSRVPVLNTASQLLTDAEKMIRERRTFHQNMLLHYFEEYEAETGIAPKEWDHVLSSIYESRIPWLAYWMSKQAVQTWDTFGVKYFSVDVRKANTRVRELRANAPRMGKRINFAFQRMTNEKGEDVIVNLFNTQGMFKKNPAVAFYVNSPKKIRTKRVLLQLANFGLSFLPIGNTPKSLASKYLKSFYETQRITEGSLFAHFEATNNQQGMQQIKAQYLNPFDNL